MTQKQIIGLVKLFLAFFFSIPILIVIWGMVALKDAVAVILGFTIGYFVISGIKGLFGKD